MIHLQQQSIMSIAQIQIKSLDQLLARRYDIAVNNVLPVGLPDAVAYYYVKQASFLSKKEERWSFFLFQGLNAYPQNLSIYLRDEAQRQNKSGKQKLSKGVFVIYELFGKCQMVVEINIPGNLKIYKLVNDKKELVSNEEIDLMYLSSVFRSMYQVNLPWGRYYHLFHDSKDYIQELKNFYNILFRTIAKRDINVGSEFESNVSIKGSHCCSLVFIYMKDRKLVRHSIEIIQQLFSKRKDYRECPKFSLLLAEFYLEIGKVSRCLEIVSSLLEVNPKDPFLLFYQAKYLHKSGMDEQALIVCNCIVQYHQFEIWILLAQIHLSLNNFSDVLVCLNHSVKLTKIKGIKSLDLIYRAFEELGKIKMTCSADSIENSPKYLNASDSPLTILVKQVEESNKVLVERGYWKLNANEKIIYNILQDLRYRLESKKFEELLISTFEDSIVKYDLVVIKRGTTQLQNAEETVSQKLISDRPSSFRDQEEQDLPDFLKNNSEKMEESFSSKPGRNLSIIPEIQSVIENSNYEEKEKDKNKKFVKYKREVNEGLFKIVQILLTETDFEKAEYENNVAKLLPVYNKMRFSSKLNNYFADRMFKLFVLNANYRSIIVLMAETLDFLEQRGVKKADKLPFWMHKYLFFIIEEKGLKFLNDMLQKLNFYDEALVDTIEIAKNWKMKGVTY